jgi:uncharacterized protein with ParB-like and HNH nuclease domain
VAETQKQLADRLFPVVYEQDEVELRNIPPEQRRLHTETADLTVLSIHQYLANGKMEIPEFQRGYVWTRTQASRLIKSLIIQCPIPVVYLSQTSENKLLVIDGNQRLLSIKLFMNDAFELQGLTTYPELNSLSWSRLDPRFRDHISNRTIRCITILKETHPQIKFDVFERLNTGSVKLNSQELRHGLSYGFLIKQLDELTKPEKWRKAVGIRNDKRMKGAELVLRYFAFRHDRKNYAKPLSGFLDQFSGKHKNISEEEAARWAVEFNKTLDKVVGGFGVLAFRLYEADLVTHSAFNSALFDAQMIAFAETKNSIIIEGKYDVKLLQAAAQKLFKDEEFMSSIKQATSDDGAVKTRFEKYAALLNGFKNAV